jgi:hypothetical protein
MHAIRYMSNVKMGETYFEATRFSLSTIVAYVIVLFVALKLLQVGDAGAKLICRLLNLSKDRLAGNKKSSPIITGTVAHAMDECRTQAIRCHWTSNPLCPCTA